MGGGRCFPAYEKIAAVAKCARSTVAVALRELEDAGILTWVNRIARIRRQQRDLDTRPTKADWALYDRRAVGGLTEPWPQGDLKTCLVVEAAEQ